jgi:hypothetical protein
LLHGPADASAGAFAPLSARKAAAPAAQAVKKFLLKSFYNAPQAWKADILPPASADKLIIPKNH